MIKKHTCRRNNKPHRTASTIRRSMKKGNGKGCKMRGRINRWSFHMLQSMILYKAGWEGIPVEFVNPSYTSKRCSLCGEINRKLGAEKEWQCPSCGATLDRDFNAAKNILLRSKQVCMAVMR